MKRRTMQTAFEFFVALWFIAASVLAIDSMRSSVGMDIQNFVWELFKVIVGPFIGATLAFRFNRKLQDDRRRQEEAAEIYGAAASIQSMYLDFLRYRRSVHDVAADRALYYQTFEGEAPVWAYAARVLFTFGATGTPDLSKLHFLNVSDEGRAAFGKCQDVIKAYFDLETADKLLSPIVDELQQKLETIQKINWKEDSEAIGHRITYSVRDLYIGTLVLLEDERFYLSAYESLINVANVHYGDTMKLRPLPAAGNGYNIADLRPLPALVVEALKNAKDSYENATKTN